MPQNTGVMATQQQGMNNYPPMPGYNSAAAQAYAQPTVNAGQAAMLGGFAAAVTGGYVDPITGQPINNP